MLGLIVELVHIYDTNYAQILCLRDRFVVAKAGRFVGLADCYAVIALADNATFLLVVNRIAAFRSHFAIICMQSAAVPLWTIFFHMFVPTSACTVGAELSYLGFG